MVLIFPLIHFKISFSLKKQQLMATKTIAPTCVLPNRVVIGFPKTTLLSS